MKKFLVPLLFAAALLVSCEKQQESTQPVPKGDAIEFSMSSTAVNTKTSYGDIVNNKQTINWENNDQFTVYCGEAFISGSDGHQANYKVSTSGSSSAATPVDPNTQLMWGGDGQHTFYAAYKGSLNGNVYSASIPSNQVLSGTNNVFAPLISDYGFMVAAATATKATGVVSLSFKPSFSTIEFIVGPGPNAEAVVSGFRLESSSGPIAGDFNATLSTSSPYYSGFKDSENSISVRFGENGSVNLGRNDRLTFTVIALPKDMTNLTAYFTVDNKEVSIPLKSGESFITFRAGRKSRINAPAVFGPEAVEAGITTVIEGQDIDEYSLGQQ
ncbi:MAG: fimbrillin family protein [Bacteroidales bacterium]|nr:fimbrillin family protein [Bacteroidales bacterium]